MKMNLLTENCSKFKKRFVIRRFIKLLKNKLIKRFDFETKTILNILEINERRFLSLKDQIDLKRLDELRPTGFDG